MFFDLADPAKRLDADLHAALKIIGEFQQHNDVILGLNESESQHVAKVLRLKKTPNNPKGAASLAAAIREKLEIHTVVIHPIQYAAGADAQGETFVNGPFTAKPKISTALAITSTPGLLWAGCSDSGLRTRSSWPLRLRVSTSATPSARIASSSSGSSRRFSW